MLRFVNLKNFKSWETLDIEFGAVTGLFGPNSSGKSSIIQFLLLLKQTKNAIDRSLVLDFGGPDQLINLGSFQDVVRNRDRMSVMSWKIKWDLSSRLTIKDPSGSRVKALAVGSKMSLAASVQIKDNSLYCGLVNYWFGGYRFKIEPKKEGSTEFSLRAVPPEDSNFRFVRNQARAWALPGPIKTHLFPDQAKTYFQNSDFLGALEAEYEELMDSVYYLGPLREYPRREYPWSGARPSDVGRRGERVIEALLAATLRGETRNLGGRTRYKKFQEMIAYWLKELGLIYDFKIEEIGSGANLYRALVKRDAYSPEVLLTDVGFGVSQVLPALVLLYYVPSGSTVLMEQPEIHLHPSVQSGLADVIISVAKTRNVQVIVESHSEHFLRRLQRRVAEDDSFAPGFIKLYFCDSARGRSRLSDLELNLFGQIENWPVNFFGDEMTEIAETQKAILERKAAEGA